METLSSNDDYLIGCFFLNPVVDMGCKDEALVPVPSHLGDGFGGKFKHNVPVIVPTHTLAWPH
jgi:hypothetical protein